MHTAWSGIAMVFCSQKASLAHSSEQNPAGGGGEHFPWSGFPIASRPGERPIASRQVSPAAQSAEVVQVAPLAFWVPGPWRQKPLFLQDMPSTSSCWQG
jgi:hypothetical protein